MRTHIRAKDKLPAGKVKIEVETTYVEPRPAGPLKVVMKVNGKEVASGKVPVSAPLLFTANDCLDFGIDLGSPVSVEYYDNAPFKFNGKIEQAHVQYLGVLLSNMSGKSDYNYLRVERAHTAGQMA